MIRGLTVTSLFVVLMSIALAGKAAPVREGDQATVESVAGRETDVAVSIENATDKSVRHLVPGVVGKNAPWPRRPPAQPAYRVGEATDCGKPADGMPIEMRVALGVGAKHEKMHIEDPHIGNSLNRRLPRT